MIRKPFDVEKIRMLLTEDRVEAAIDVLLANLKTVVGEAEKISTQGNAFMNTGLAFLIPTEIRQIINEFRNTIIVLSASIKRIERDFKNQIIEWAMRYRFRNKVIISINSLLEELEKFNKEYEKLFPLSQEFMPSPSAPGFLKKAQVYISIVSSLSRKLEEFTQIESRDE